MLMIRIVTKLILIPIIAVLKLICLLGNVFANLSAYVLSPLILFVLACGIYCLAKARWTDVFLLAGIEAFILAAMFGSVWLIMLIEDLNQKLIGMLQRNHG